MTTIESDDTVIDIGAGRGMITEQLVSKVRKVISIEYDNTLANQLKEKFENVGNVEVIEVDFLKWELPSYPYKVFSNIPFNRTADIVGKLLEKDTPLTSAYLIMQDKAAKRFIGKPVASNSQASILLKPFYDMKIIAAINRNQFKPMPNVNIVLVAFDKKENPKIEYKNKQDYRDFIIYGYNQWKPTVLEAFKDIFSYKQIKIIGEKLGIGNYTPKQLNLDDWIELFNIYLEHVPHKKKRVIRGYENKFKDKHSNIKKLHRTR